MENPGASAEWKDLGTTRLTEKARAFRVFETTDKGGKVVERVFVPYPYVFLNDKLAIHVFSIQSNDNDYYISITEITLVGLGPDFVKVKLTSGEPYDALKDSLTKKDIKKHIPALAIGKKDEESEFSFHFNSSSGTLCMYPFYPVQIKITPVYSESWVILEPALAN